MPIGGLKSLYKALEQDGAVQNGEENFLQYMLAPGDQGYQNRKALYDALHKDGAVEAPNYEDFVKRLGLTAQDTMPQQPGATPQQGQPQQPMQPGEIPEPQQQQGYGGFLVPDTSQMGLNAPQKVSVTAPTPGLTAEIKGIGAPMKENPTPDAEKPGYTDWREGVSAAYNTPVGGLDATLGGGYSAIFRNFVGGAVTEAIKRADAAGSQASNDFLNKHRMSGTAMAGTSGGATGAALWMMGEKEGNKKRDPEAIMKEIERALPEMITGNKPLMDYIARSAEENNISRGDFTRAIVPILLNDIRRELYRQLVDRKLPKDDIHWMVDGIMDSATGKLYEWLTDTKGGQEITNYAREMTQAGENPYYQPGFWADTGRFAASLFGKIPEFAAFGGLGTKATGALFGTTSSMARLTAAGYTEAQAAGALAMQRAGMSAGRRILLGAAEHSVSGAITLGGVDSMDEALRQLRDREDFDIWKVAGHGGQGALTGVLFGSTGGAWSGLTARATGLGRLWANIAGFEIESAVMGGMTSFERWKAGEHLDGKDLVMDWLKGNVQTAVMKGVNQHGVTAYKNLFFNRGPQVGKGFSKEALEDLDALAKQLGVDRMNIYADVARGRQENWTLETDKEGRAVMKQKEKKIDPLSRGGRTREEVGQIFTQFMTDPTKTWEARNAVAEALGLPPLPKPGAHRTEVNGTEVATWDLQGNFLETKNFKTPEEAYSYAKAVHEESQLRNRRRLDHDNPIASQYAAGMVTMGSEEAMEAVGKAFAKPEAERTAEDKALIDDAKKKQNDLYKLLSKPESELTDEELKQVRAFDRILEEEVLQSEHVETIIVNRPYRDNDNVATVQMLDANGKIIHETEAMSFDEANSHATRLTDRMGSNKIELAENKARFVTVCNTFGTLLVADFAKRPETRVKRYEELTKAKGERELTEAEETERAGLEETYQKDKWVQYLFENQKTVEKAAAKALKGEELTEGEQKAWETMQKVQRWYQRDPRILDGIREKFEEECDYASGTIADVLAKPDSERSEAEKNIFDEYMQWVSGRMNNRMKSDSQLAFDYGWNATPEQRADIRDKFAAADADLRQRMGYDGNTDIARVLGLTEGNEEKIKTRIRRGNNTPEEKKAAITWINLRSQMRGVEQSVESDVIARIDAANKDVDMKAGDDGMIREVTLTETVKDENGQDVPVKAYIKSGTIFANGDGTINEGASDRVIFVRVPGDDGLRPIDVRTIKSLDGMYNTEEYRNDAVTKAEAQARAEAYMKVEPMPEEVAPQQEGQPAGQPAGQPVEGGAQGPVQGETGEPAAQPVTRRITIAGEDYNVEVLGEENGRVKLKDLESGDVFDVARDRFDAFAKAADDKAAAEAAAQQAAASKEERYQKGIQGYAEGNPDVLHPSTDVDVAIEYLKENREPKEVMTEADQETGKIDSELEKVNTDITELEDWIRKYWNLAEETQQVEKTNALNELRERQAELQQQRDRWQQIKVGMMTKEERAALREERQKHQQEVETTAAAEVAAEKMDAPGTISLDNSDILDTYPTRSEARNAMASEFRALDRRVSEIDRRIRKIDDDLASWRDGGLMGEEELHNALAERERLRRERGMITSRLDELAGKSRQLARLYKAREEADMTPWERKIAAFEKETDYVKRMQKMAEAIMADDELREEDREMLLDIIKDDQPRDVYEYVASMMPYGQLNWEGKVGDNYRPIDGLQQKLGKNKKRGIGRGFDTNAYNAYLAPKGQGKAFDQMAHEIWQECNGAYEDTEVSNAMLELFQSASKPTDISHYILNNRVNEIMSKREQILDRYEAEREADEHAIETGENVPYQAPREPSDADLPFPMPDPNEEVPFRFSGGKVTDNTEGVVMTEEENQRREPLRARIRQWAEASGADVEIIESLDQTSDWVRGKIEEARRNGKVAKGWAVRRSDGSAKVYFYLPGIKDVADIDKTYLHEVVSHVGLKEMMDKKQGGFDKLCDLVWKTMDEETQNKWLHYPGVIDITDLQRRKRLAADEYMAKIAEEGTDTTAWRKIVAAVRRALRELGFNIKMSDDDIRDLIRRSRERMENEKATIEEMGGVHSVTQAAQVRDVMFNIVTEPDLEKKLMSYARTKDAKNKGWTKEKMAEIVEETGDLIKAIHAGLSGNRDYDEFAKKNPTMAVDWRDGEMHYTVTWSRNNIEYKYDMSADLLCVNNDAMESVLGHPKMIAVIKQIAENNPDPKVGYSSNEYLRLYDIMDDMGFVVQCKGCFDAAGRFKMLPSVAQNFANEVNAIIDERNTNPAAFDKGIRDLEKKRKAVNGMPVTYDNREEAVRVAVAAENITEHIDFTDLLTAEGQTKMLEEHGGLFRAWQRTGAGRPKDKLLAEPYIGDIVDRTGTIIAPYKAKTPSYRDIMVNVGTGLRRNSHSEMRPYLAIDEIQMMRDAYVRDLCVFKYMKELDDVRLFGNLGVKYNISFFPAFDRKGTAAGLDSNGDYIASEESVGAREFPYKGKDGKTHYDGMKGWHEAEKYRNDDVSLSSVIFSIPHLIKALADVPTPKDPRGRWGSLIPFHASGATPEQIAMQKLGYMLAADAAAGGAHPFEEAFSDWNKGVTNFEQVQNDRFGEGWVIVEGKKAGTNVETGHKLEFVNGTHYYNPNIEIDGQKGIHLFSKGWMTDADFQQYGKPGRSKKHPGLHPFEVDYNEKVRELGTPYAYKEAADYYLEELPKIGLIPRFGFAVPEEVFIEACKAANVDPRDPKLGWKGEGHDWNPIDSDAYYSLFCDYGMTKADGTLSPHRPVGYIDENGNRTFRLPDNAAEIARRGADLYTSRRDTEDKMVDEAIRRYADSAVEDGKLTQEQADAILGSEEGDTVMRVDEEKEGLFETAERVANEERERREEKITQGFDSAKTSRNQTPAGMKNIPWESGTVNVDIGGGKWEKATNWLRERGVENLVFDPFNRDAEHNRTIAERMQREGSDTATCCNVLNVIDTERSRANVILQAARAIKPGGTAYFTIYEGDKSGVGRQTRDGWQNNRPTKDYIDEIKRYFNDVTLKKDVIIARDPKTTDEQSVWDFDGTFSGNSISFRVDDEDRDKRPEDLATRYQKKTVEDMASGKVPFNGKVKGDDEPSKFKVIDDGKKSFRNFRGNPINRYKDNVGKEISGKVYVHKDYAAEVIPEDIYNKALETAEKEGFQFNSVCWDKKNTVRFDEAPDFDTAREPITGNFLTVDGETGEVIRSGRSEQIWHHKWAWVKDDYQGFDVEEAYNWSKEWSQKISNPDAWGYKWDYLLDQAGLPKDWRGSALSARPDEEGETSFRVDDENSERKGYNPRWRVPKVRGGWTEKKILNFLKHNPSRHGRKAAFQLISEFDNIEDLKAHMFWHGSGNAPRGLMPSITKSERWAEQYGGGGYGDRYWGISITNHKPTATNFGGMNARGTSVYPIILAKNAKVESLPDASDAADVEGDVLIDLWERGVDAVWIGKGGENELLVLNPMAIVNTDASTYYQYYGLKNSDVTTFDDAGIQRMLDIAKEQVANPYKSRAPKKPSRFADGEMKSYEQYQQELEQYQKDLGAYFESDEYKEDSAKDRELTDSIRFRVDDDRERKPAFYSNAEKAVEGISQKKATGDQWLAMIQKAGGLKAGEDKWLGLSDWLNERKGKPVTKEEVMNFIRENQVQIEEVNYSENGLPKSAQYIEEIPEVSEGMDYLQEEFERYKEEFYESGEEYDEDDPYETEATNYAVSRLEEKYPGVSEAFNIGATGVRSVRTMEPKEVFDVLGLDASDRQINSTRMDYTTEGLDNKKEIALTVPTIESWNENDDVHFGDAGEGRAVAWIRFGDTTDAEGNRVLVIDEIQSNRHQEGREKGYADHKAVKAYNDWMDAKAKEHGVERYQVESRLSDDEYREKKRLQEAAKIDNGIPDAPFEKNWHELAMKRMLRYAAENGYDKVAWTTGDQQSERYDLAAVVDNIAYVELPNGEIDARAYLKDGGYEFLGRTWEEVEKNVGKDMVRRMQQGESNRTDTKEWGRDKDDEPIFYDYNIIEGDGLRIGGEGMKGFYDEILPRFMKKYGKKWGATVGEVELPYVEESGRRMHAVDVTPEMKESVMEGQPMFSFGEAEEKKDPGVYGWADRRRSSYWNDKPEFKSVSDAAWWCYDLIGNVRSAGERDEYIGKDYSRLLSMDDSHGEQVDVEKAKKHAGMVIPMAEMMKKHLIVARDRSKSEAAARYVQGLIDECDNAIDWYQRAAKGDRTIFDDERPRMFRVSRDGKALDKKTVDGTWTESEVRVMEQKLGGTKVSIDTEETIPETVRRRLLLGEDVKGWYDESDGSVHLYAPAIESVEDARYTICHEKLGHEGLTALLGSQQAVTDWGNFMYLSASRDLRAQMDEIARTEFAGDDNAKSKAAQEVFAQIAEDGPRSKEEFSLWRRVKHFFIKQAQKRGWNVRGLLNDADMRYYVLKTGEALKRYEGMDDAQKMETSRPGLLFSTGGSRKPRKRQNESMASFLQRLERWEVERQREEDMRLAGAEAPEKEPYEQQWQAKYEEDDAAWRERHGLTSDEPEGYPRRQEGESDESLMQRVREYEQWEEAMRDQDDKRPIVWEYEQKAYHEWRDAVKEFERQWGIEDEDHAALDLFDPPSDGPVDIEEVSPSGRPMTPEEAAAEHATLQELGDALGADMSARGAKRHTKLAVIQRRKDLEGRSAEDAIYVHELSDKINAVARRLIDETGADQSKKDVAEKIRHAIPFIIEIPRRQREIADDINSSLVWQYGRLVTINGDDIAAASRGIDDLRDAINRYGIDSEEAKDAARRIADTINARHEGDIVGVIHEEVVNNGAVEYLTDLMNNTEPAHRGGKPIPETTPDEIRQNADDLERLRHHLSQLAQAINAGNVGEVRDSIVGDINAVADRYVEAFNARHAEEISNGSRRAMTTGDLIDIMWLSRTKLKENDARIGVQGLTGSDVLAIGSMFTRRVLPEEVDFPIDRVQDIVDEIGDWYSNWFMDIENAGLRPQDIGRVTNYVNHRWEHESGLGAKIGDENYQRTRSANMRERTIPTLMTGLEVGLTPKSTDIVDLMSYYSRHNAEAVANKGLIDALENVKIYETDADGEPIASVSLLTREEPELAREKYELYDIPGQGLVWVHKEASNWFANVFGPIHTSGEKSLWQKTVSAYDTAGSTAKKIELSFSGFHMGALTEVYIAQMIAQHPKDGLQTFVKFMITDCIKKGTLPCYANPEVYKDAAKHLVKLGANDDYANKEVVALTAKFREMLKDTEQKMAEAGLGKTASKVVVAPDRLIAYLLDWANNGMDAILWSYLHDGLKLAAYDIYARDIRKRAPKEGWDETTIDQMLDEAGQYVNDMFGGQYWEIINVSPAQLKLMQRFLLSPDWLISTNRHFFANFGFGSLYSDQNFKEYMKNNWMGLKRLLPKEYRSEKDIYRAFRSTNSKWCYLLGVSMFFYALWNGVNAWNRKKDIEEQQKIAEKRRAAGDDQYMSPYESIYGEDLANMKWWDYTMFGNAMEKKTHAFYGRGSGGQEVYMRWGKQFREFPELFENEKGETDFPFPLMNRLLSKANPIASLLFESLMYSSPRRQTYWDKRLIEQYGMHTGYLMKIASRFKPFSMPSDEKESTWIGLVFPTSKGFTFNKAKDYLRDFMEREDWEGFREVYRACALNGIDFDAAYNIVANDIEKTARQASRSGIESKSDAVKRFDASNSLSERKTLMSTIENYQSKTNARAMRMEEAVETAKAEFTSDKDNDPRQWKDYYILGAKGSDIEEDSAMSWLKRQCSKYKGHVKYLEETEGDVAANLYRLRTMPIQNAAKNLDKVWKELNELKKEYARAYAEGQQEKADETMRKIREKRNAALERHKKLAESIVPFDETAGASLESLGWVDNLNEE